MTYTFDKLYNFRDLGGHIGNNGRPIKKGRLLRSGNLASLTEKDVETLKTTYNLKNIIDLRTRSEKEKDPDVEVPGTIYYDFDFFQGSDDVLATGSSNQLQSLRTITQVNDMMKNLYSSFITDAGVCLKLREILQILLNTPQGSTLWHCFAGKDRAGITAAVILTILGVNKTDIFADYEVTNQMRKKENEEILDRLSKQNISEEMLEAIEVALYADKAYLAISYQSAQEQYGSFEAYIINGIGFKTSEWELLRNMYLE